MYLTVEKYRKYVFSEEEFVRLLGVSGAVSYVCRIGDGNVEVEVKDMGDV